MAEGRATTIRFAEKIYGRLEKASEESGLPINSIVVVAVLDWLESHPPELVGRGTRGFESTSIRPLQRSFARRLERRMLPWPGSPQAFDQFSRSAQSALLTAQRSAEGIGAEYIGTTEVLFGLLEHGLAGRILKGCDITTVMVQRLKGAVKPSAPSPELLLPSTRVKTVLQLAMDEADKDGLQYVGTEHLLLGLVLEGESAAARFLADKGITEARIREEIGKLRSEEEA